MVDCEIVFGNLKRPERIPVKDLLVWPESEIQRKPQRENIGRWVSETQEAYKSYEPAPIIKVSDQLPELIDTPLKQEEIIQDVIEKPVEPKVNLKKPKKASKSSRNLSDSAFAHQYDKPIFACYGQGNASISNKRLFSKGHMKSFNINPLKSSNDKKSVYDTAQIQSFIKDGRLAFTKSLKEKEKNPVIVENPAETTEQPANTIEIIEELPEVKIDSSTQVIPEISDVEQLCRRCQNHIDSESLDYRKAWQSSQSTDVKDPRKYKNLPPSFTKSIPSAGKPINKSVSSYKVIFGD